MTTFTITDCINESQLHDFINQASDGDTITFACSGTIPLTSTLTIKRKGQTGGHLTLDGGGEAVILDGGNKVGVLRVEGMHLTLKGVTLANGNADESGGGLFISQSSEVTIDHCTFCGNSARHGGGLFNDGGQVSITNCTFCENAALAYGGGLYTNFGGQVTVIQSTFAKNTANMGGGWATTYGSFSVSATIVANNTATVKGKNSLFKVSSLGNNLEDGSECGFSDPTFNDHQNTDPLLDPTGLQNHGGATPTLALQSGSPAMGAIPIQLCPPSDQRGHLRPAGLSFGDIGAYQSSYLAPSAPPSP